MTRRRESTGSGSHEREARSARVGWAGGLAQLDRSTRRDNIHYNTKVVNKGFKKSKNSLQKDSH